MSTPIRNGSFWRAASRPPYNGAMHYEHRQSGRIYIHMIVLVAVLMMTTVLLAVLWNHDRDLGALMAGIAAAVVSLFLIECFQILTVWDAGDCLMLRYGPIPLFWKRFSYSQMTAVRPSRLTVFDGRGISYLPGRGWTYHLSGVGCVKVQMGQKSVRIGTDDVEGLVAFLQTKIVEARP